ncbi:MULTISPECIES: hypothetical protein [Pseudomonas]|uniref:Uncharacterized protein n=1 Tax=Pseudomonas helleri TaxID=1608996 RepID=A0A7X1WZI0_9PSED|nr:MULTISPECIES: hypothetical protein [Pseudomonas]MBM1204778.1 hypothetical protein [Pseudomonas fragi]MBM1204874.1 hypothetical protein [Pseudomonas fragi]MQT77669.1 hypothetical protein [Pseudomonas helleri]NMY57954.1 hypothetical protein [Pseudomonas sp. WS 5051]
MADVLFDFDNPGDAARSLKRVAQAMQRAGQPVVSHDFDAKQVAASPSGDHQSSFASLRSKGLGALQSQVVAGQKKAQKEAEQTTAKDDQLTAATELLQSVIAGTTEMDSGLADRLQAVHDQFAGVAEFDALFEQAAQAFADAMVAKARSALAA